MADFPKSPTGKVTIPENVPHLAQGHIVPATSSDIQADETGITYPNLHRRLDLDLVEIIPPDIEPSTYEIFVSGTHSYRTISHTIHDDDSTTSEVP